MRRLGAGSCAQLGPWHGEMGNDQGPMTNGVWIVRCLLLLKSVVFGPSCHQVCVRLPHGEAQNMAKWETSLYLKREELLVPNRVASLRNP